MADEFKSIRDNLLKAVIGGITDSREKLSDEEAADESMASIRAILGTLSARAGKSKDEVVQILARETGIAIAAMLREPLRELAENRRLQITFEFVPKTGDEDASVEITKAPKKPAAKKKKTTKKKNT